MQSAPHSERPSTTDVLAKVDGIMQAIRRRFALLAVLGAMQIAGVALLVDDATAVATGIPVAVFYLVFVSDLGRRLDHNPRGLRLVKARFGAAVSLGLVPVGTVLGWSLLHRLRHPILVKHALSNHPASGSVADEVVVDRIRVRSSYVAVRNAGLGFALFAGGLWLILPDLPEPWAAVAAAIAGVSGVVQLAGGIAGAHILKSFSETSVSQVRMISWCLLPMVPFGTYAWWATRQVQGSTVSGEVGASAG